MTELGSRKLHIGAALSLLCLIALAIAWECFISPYKPGNYFFAIKVIPLFFAIRGVLTARVYTLQWSSMLVLLYFMEGVVRASGDADPASRLMAALEIVLSISFYLCAILYVRPFKRLAKKLEKEKKAEQQNAAHNTLDRSQTSAPQDPSGKV